MADSLLFSGKNCLIFGAAGSLGRAICLRLVARGGFVVAVDSDETALFELAQNNPERIAPLALDVSDGTALARLTGNWGPEPLHALIFVQPETEDDAQDTLLNVVDVVTRQLAPVLEAAGGAALALGHAADETASARHKAQARALETLTRELASDGARINCMSLYPAARTRQARGSLCAAVMMMLLPMSAAIGGAVLPIGQHGMPS